MGDSPPEFLDLSCGDCGTRFRIRPTKGRLPRGPVECPSCSNLVPIEAAPAPSAPAAAMFRSRKGTKSEEMRLMDVLKSLPESTAPGGTLMGMSVAESMRAEARARLDESTAAATDSDLFPDDPRDFNEGGVTHTPTHKMFALDEHSESAFNNRTKAPWESESTNKAARQANIIAKVNPRKTQPSLEPINMRSEVESSSKSDAFADDSDVSNPEAFSRVPTRSSKSAERPKLADLLKQVREKRGPLVTPSPVTPLPHASKAFDDPLGESIFPSDHDIVADLGPTPAEVRSKVPANQEDNRMTPFGKARADTVVRALESHGMAAEKTGSGFIRIPTAEILDLIGTGTYRLRVENVVYEPIDEVGIRRLVRTEFLTGDEFISERGGDWVVMSEHAFFRPASAAPIAMIEEEISEAEALEELFEPPAVLSRSDGSGELFPTIGHLSPDQSAEIELSYAEHSSSEIVDSEVSHDEIPNADVPLTAELDLDDLDELDDLQTVSEVFPPQTPAAPDDLPTKTSAPRSRSIWLPLALVAIAGILVGAVFKTQIFGAPGLTPVDEPIVDSIQDPVAVIPDTVTAAQAVVGQTAAQVPVIVEEPPTVVEQVPVEVNSVRKLTAPELINATLAKENKTPVLKFSLNGAPVTFIADTGESQRSFRSNEAVAVLCRAAKCGIDFAKIQDAFLSSDELKALGIELTGALSKLDDVSGIRGILRWDVQGAAQLPLAELTSVWRKWMGLSDQDLDKAVSESEKDITKAIGEERTRALLAQAGQIRVRDLVRQISNVLVLDYLTNNFERFESGQGQETWNLAVKNGRVVSLDEGGAFQPRASTRIKGRFSWVEKFDKDVFESFSQLKRDELDSKIFDDSTAAERVALRVFWKQQQAYVDRVQKETLRRPDALFF